ncbi:MAG: hypothetical protein IH899_03585 [Planctomycetes bacterium]|nr:hypothetical protein [Planctomycetota bacterium]
MNRRLFEIVSLTLLVGAFSGCQASRGWFSSSRVGSLIDSKSPVIAKDVGNSSHTIQTVSAEQEVPIVTATEKKSGSGASSWSKLFGSLTKKPKRIPLPRTDSPTVSEPEKSIEANPDADVPTLNDF